MLRPTIWPGGASRCATRAVQRVLRCSANFGLGLGEGGQARVGPMGRWTGSGSATLPTVTPPTATSPIATPPATRKLQSMSMCPRGCYRACFDAPPAQIVGQSIAMCHWGPCKGFCDALRISGWAHGKVNRLGLGPWEGGQARAGPMGRWTGSGWAHGKVDRLGFSHPTLSDPTYSHLTHSDPTRNPKIAEHVNVPLSALWGLF